jgi:MFS family permease
MPLPSALRSLRHRNYQLFFSGQLISLIGTWMDTVAESWLVYKLTHSAVLLGVTAFASQIPVFALALFGGVIADSRDRRKVLIATQSASMVLAFILAGLTLSGVVTVHAVIIIAALFGLVNAIDIPTRQAFVVDMVAREDLMNAIALNSSMFNAARIVGPAVAGILVAAIGEGWCFFANAVSYIAVITGLLLMRTEPRQRKSEQATALEQIKQGIAFVRTAKPIAALLTLLGIVSLFGMSYSVLMPIFADQILHAGPKGLGTLMGFSGVGALCGALTLLMKKELKGLGRWIMLACGGFGVSIMAFSQTHNLRFGSLFLVLAGFCMMLQMSSSNTLVQSMSPDALRGRVMALYSMMFMGMAPLGSLLAGTVANHLGAPMTVALGGSACVLAAVAFGFALPRIRPHARRLIVAQQAEAGTPAQQITGSLPVKS